jgi:membrane protein DedA with SNARE-associated domain/rhodanese-related sulfurtransferase
MDALLPLLTQYGYPILALIVFLEAIGLPVPAAPALLAVGAASAKGILSPYTCLSIALLSMLAADTILFVLGRATGWWLLGLLCRLSVNPEACIYSSAAYFHRRGRTALLFAKFIPGINTMAPPMAGSMNMHPWVFFRYDLLGALFYILTYGLLGYTFHTAIAAITEWLTTLGRFATFLIATALASYFAFRIWRARRSRKSSTIPRISVDDLASRLTGDILIADVRSHGYYDTQAERIQGSIRIEPNRLPEILPTLPKDREVYLYCSCLNEATSQRVAELLREGGFEASVIVGGLSAWKKAGHPLEQVPAEDVVHLPRFV